MRMKSIVSAHFRDRLASDHFKFQVNDVPTIGQIKNWSKFSTISTQNEYLTDSGQQTDQPTDSHSKPALISVFLNFFPIISYLNLYLVAMTDVLSSNTS